MNCEQCRINLKFALENPEEIEAIKQRDQGLPTTPVAQSTSAPGSLTAGVIGVITGLIGVAIGFYPIASLHYFLADLAEGIIGRGSYLVLLVTGVPLPLPGILFVPFGGAIFGLVGAIIGVRRHYERELNSNKQKAAAVAALWGAISGSMFNMCVSFWAQ
jgi:hypothetical protein